MSKERKPKYEHVYPAKFNYDRASKDANCNIPPEDCPALVAQGQGAPHSLIPLGRCAGCRKDPEAYIKHLQELARKEKSVLTRTANDTSKPR